MPPVCTSCMRLGNACVCLGNTKALLHVVPAKLFFISTAHDQWRAMRHVSAPEPTSEAGRGPEPRDVCQCRSPPRRRGRVRCRGTHDSTEALLDGEVGSGA
jgi:hypothetical protein